VADALFAAGERNACGISFYRVLASSLFVYNDAEEETRKEEKKLFVQPPWSNLEVADR
jgi:hypothetical protein